MRTPRNTAAGAGAIASGKRPRVKNLLDLRQRIQFALLTLSRIALGFFDLALAAAMYLLFMLLQRRAPSLHLWWMPATALAAAFLATTLIALRAFVDLASSRSVFRSIQNLYVDFLLRLTRGYSEMEWSRFVEHNRSELGSQALHTSREAADFYHRSIEFIAGATTLAVMTAAIAWQSLPAAAAFAIALAAFYCLHRFLIRGKISQAASDREESVRSLERLLADFLMSGKEIRTYRNYAFFQDRIQLQASRLAQSSRRTVFLPQIGRIIADQGTMLLFLGLIVAVELQHGDTGRLLSLLAFYFVLSRRLLPLVSQMSLIAGQLEGLPAERENRCRAIERVPVVPGPLAADQPAAAGMGVGNPSAQLLISQRRADPARCQSFFARRRNCHPLRGFWDWQEFPAEFDSRRPSARVGSGSCRWIQHRVCAAGDCAPRRLNPQQSALRAA